MREAGNRPPELASIALLPKAELHVHLEGTADRQALVQIAGGEAALDPRFAGGGFPAFLDHYRALLDLLSDPRDYGRLASIYLERAPAHGLRHVEVTVSMGSALRRGHDPRAVLDSIRAAADVHRGTTTLTVLVDTVRQFGAQEAERVLDAVLPHLDLGVVCGFGMGGDERSVPAAAFRRAFERAREHGLGTTVHAGEAGGPETVTEVVEALRPDRIAHGISAARDPRLLERLADAGTTLDICPGSNLATGVVRSPEEHPLRSILAAGVPVTLGTDDPGIFDTDLSREYALASRIAALSLEDLQRIARHSLQAAFPPARA